MIENSYTHLAWVPTTTSHMSFRNIGQNRANIFASAVVGDVDSDQHYRVICMGMRVNVDAGPIVRAFYRLKAKFWHADKQYHSYMVVISKTKPAKSPYLKGDGTADSRLDPRGALNGKIFLIDYGANSSEHNNNREIYRKCLDLVLAGPSPTIGEVSPQLSPKSTFRELHSFSRVRFSLARNGEILMAYEQGEAVPAADTETQKIEIRQAYLFLKDCAHIHHHHDSADDQMIPVCERGDDDIEWRKQTLWSLVRSAGQKRRYGDWRNRNSALGILSYAQSFQNLNAKIFRGSDGGFHTTTDISTFDFSSQKLSMEILERKDAREVGSKLALIVSAIALISSLFIAAITITTSFYEDIYLISYEALVLPLIIWMVLASLIYDAQFSSRSYFWEPLRRFKRALTFYLLRLISHKYVANLLVLIGATLVASAFLV